MGQQDGVIGTDSDEPGGKHAGRLEDWQNEHDDDEHVPPRADGLNNPMSCNSSIGLDRDSIENMAEECDVVSLYKWDGKDLIIEWTFGESDRFSDMQAAVIAMRDNNV